MGFTYLQPPNVYITDPVTGNMASVNSQGQLQTADANTAELLGEVLFYDEIELIREGKLSEELN